MRHHSFSSWAGTALSLAALIFATCLASPAMSETGNPFDQLAGEWTGGGIVTPMGGEPDKVNCKVTYKVEGEKVAQNLRCASPDTTIKTVMEMTNTNGKVSGTWTEKSYDRTGGLSGTAKDKTIHARISGDKFSGRMSINMTDKGHVINIMQLDKGSGVYRPVASMALHR